MNSKMVNRALLATLGSFVFAVGVNIIIMPLSLYNGALMGIAQLIRTLLVYLKILSSGINVDGIIFWILNIPLFVLAYKVLGKKFFYLTMYTTSAQTFFMTILKVPEIPIVKDTLTGCIVGGFLAGFGTGLILRAGSSGGGQDTLGMVCLKKWPNFSVGKVSIILNIFVYGICLFCFDVSVTIYSLIYAVTMAVSCDRVHLQNINVTAMIFTKEDGVDKLIISDLQRGVTKWDGEGCYTKEKTKVYIVVLSKYEKHNLIEGVKKVDPNAFIIFTEGVGLEGNYEKRLS